MGVMSRPRLLPIVAVAATTLLGFKVSDLVLGNRAVVAPEARAQAASAAPAIPSAPTAATQPAKTPTVAPAAQSKSEPADAESLSPRKWRYCNSWRSGVKRS